jgi:Pyruvate/2-oxoacid:ferredoxin oxidoreductase gamma subunit
MVTHIPDSISRVFRIPAASITRNDVAEAVTANIVMLGALCKPISSAQSSRSAVVEMVPKGKEEKHKPFGLDKKVRAPDLRIIPEPMDKGEINIDLKTKKNILNPSGR